MTIKKYKKKRLVVRERLADERTDEVSHRGAIY